MLTSLFERRAAGLYHNTAVVFDADGSLALVYRKMHIPDDPLTCVCRGAGRVLEELDDPIMERALVAETYSRSPR